MSTLEVTGSAVIKRTAQRSDENQKGFLNLNLKVNYATPKQQLLILMIDKSGSMSGRPFQQVKESLKIISTLQSDKKFGGNLTLKLILFDSNAYNLDSISQIDEYNARGGTNFQNPLDQAQNIAQSFLSFHSDALISLAILSDGQARMPNCTNLINTLAKSSWSFSSLAFSPEHDFNILNSFIELGSIQGRFLYCENEDGPDALKDKILDMFSFMIEALNTEAIASISPDFIKFQETDTNSISLHLKKHSVYNYIVSWPKTMDTKTFKISIIRDVETYVIEGKFAFTKKAFFTNQLKAKEMITNLILRIMTSKGTIGNEDIRKFLQESKNIRELIQKDNPKPNKNANYMLYQLNQINKVLHSSLEQMNSSRNLAILSELQNSQYNGQMYTINQYCATYPMNGMMPQQNIFNRQQADYFPAHREMIPKLPAPPTKRQVIYKVNPPGMQLKKPDYCTNCKRLGHTADKCVRCTRCKKIGHDATTCTAIICERCGYLNHTAKDCRTPYCTFCRNFGHISSKCYKLNK